MRTKSTNGMLQRYEQAQTIINGVLTNKLVRNDTVFPHWIRCDVGSESHCFWYQRQTPEGKEYHLVDIEAASNTLAFDHVILASALATVAMSTVDGADAEDTTSVINPQDLPLTAVSMTMPIKGEGLQVNFQALDKRWCFTTDDSVLVEDTAALLRSGVLSPDGKKLAYVHENNLWIQDQSNGNEVPLTKGGHAHFSYGGHPSMSNEIVRWSNDSQFLLSTQTDMQLMRPLPHVNFVPLSGDVLPEVTDNKFSFSGDEHIPCNEVIIIDVGSGGLKIVNHPPIPIIPYGFGVGFLDANFAWWSRDNQRVFFIDVTRDARTFRVVKWNAQSNTTEIVLEESDDLVVRLNDNMTMPLIVPMPDTDELIWFSERSGWGHLYLYDLKSGKVKHQITGTTDGAEWLVRNILHVDLERRELLLQTSGRDPQIDPYYRDICKVNIDTGVLTSLVSGNYEYVVNLPTDIGSLEYAYRRNGIITGYSGDPNFHVTSPSGQYLLATRSRVDTIPESVLIDRDRGEILSVETADTSSLPENWTWPERAKLKASDNETDIYGVVFRPPGFSEAGSYPVIDFNSSLRNVSHLPHGSFSNGPFVGMSYLFPAALAALGFVVVVINGRGTPSRNKAFYTHHYGDHAFNSDLTDRIAGIRQLAERYPYMDTKRVGISANETPTNNAIYASLLHSNFYKTTVIHCTMDPRLSTAMLSEPAGFALPELELPYPRTPYPDECVDAFSGKLLLVVGMGVGAMQAPTYRLANALINANKDFDMLCIPNMHHAFCAYTLRREWDYLVTHLQGVTPPEQFPLRLNYEDDL